MITNLDLGKKMSYMALITLIDHLAEALERGEAVIGLFF